MLIQYTYTGACSVYVRGIPVVQLFRKDMERLYVLEKRNMEHGIGKELSKSHSQYPVLYVSDHKELLEMVEKGDCFTNSPVESRLFYASTFFVQEAIGRAS